MDGDGRERVDLARLERSAGFMIRLAQLRIYEAFHARMADWGITPTRYSLLALLHDNPPLRPGQIAEALRIKPSNVATLLAQFEADGLIERSGRSVALAPAGDALFRSILPDIVAAEEESVAMLTPIERTLLQALLDRMVNAV